MFKHILHSKNFCAKYEYVFVEVIFFAAFFLLCRNPLQHKFIQNESAFHGPHMKISFLSDFKSGNNAENRETENGTRDNAIQPDAENYNSSNYSEKKDAIPEKQNMNNAKEAKKNAPLSLLSTDVLNTASISLVKASVSAPNELGISAGGNLVYMGQEDLDRYFQDLKDLGAIWVRWDIDWSIIQPNRPDGYEWNGTDRIASTAKKYGIKSLGIITYAPQWAQTNSCPSGYHCPPADINTFANFAGKVAARYRDSIDTFEIWNEPNYYIFWYPNANAGKYAELLKATYGKIKEANSGATVISGGLVMTDSDGKSISPTSFMNSLYDSGAKNYFDAVAVHPYSYPLSPNYSADWNGWKQMNSVRQTMISRGDGGKKIWLTEYGAPTGGSGKRCSLDQLDFTYNQDYMSEDAQQAMAKDATNLYIQNNSWMGPFFWYNLRDESAEGTSPEDFFGLIRYDGSKKPAYETLKNVFSK